MSRLVWFRSDLRVTDNPALHYACDDQADVQAVFILCDQYVESHPIGPRKLWFIRESLKDLAVNLQKSGIELSLLRVAKARDIPAKLMAFCKEMGIKSLYCNAEYPIDEIERDRKVKASCEGADIAFRRYHDRCLIPPGMLKTGQGSVYRVFTPFSKAWKEKIKSARLEAYLAPETGRGKKAKDATRAIDQCFARCDLRPEPDHWQPGENIAQRKLEEFCDNALLEYDEQRDTPAEPGTSRLSPYLSIGSLSPKQCYLAAAARVKGDWEKHSGVNTWINELIWREFYMHIAQAFPALSRHKPMQAYTDGFPWRYDKTLFQRWCNGETGIPIVDAAMRQLNNTGWMHNRLRMVTAMFLCKNLKIDWRWGERYFMEQLIDADFCANNGGWQWSASTGTDAAPYFRIMNPVSQSERHDPDGQFIRRYVSELAELNNKDVHTGRGAAAYCDPIVDLKRSRQEAIDLFKSLKSNEATANES